MAFVFIGLMESYLWLLRHSAKYNLNLNILSEKFWSWCIYRLEIVSRLLLVHIWSIYLFISWYELMCFRMQIISKVLYLVEKLKLKQIFQPPILASVSICLLLSWNIKLAWGSLMHVKFCQKCVSYILLIALPFLLLT